MMHRVFVAAAALLFMANAFAQTGKNGEMSAKATGTFEVKLAPQGSAEAKSVGRMSIDKQFRGDLQAVSVGEMLAFMSEVKGSAGYVAMEKVTGTLGGHTGTFVLQHSATMTRGVPEQSVFVVPDSGTGELQGLTGKMTIIIEEGKHSYVFDYQIAPSH